VKVLKTKISLTQNKLKRWN